MLALAQLINDCVTFLDKLESLIGSVKAALAQQKRLLLDRQRDDTVEDEKSQEEDEEEEEKQEAAMVISDALHDIETTVRTLNDAFPQTVRTVLGNAYHVSGAGGVK